MVILENIFIHIILSHIGCEDIVVLVDTDKNILPNHFGRILVR